MKRRLKTTVLIHPTLLKGQNDVKIVQKKMDDKMKQQRYYNRAAHSLPPLEPSQDVQIYNNKVGR